MLSFNFNIQFLGSDTMVKFQNPALKHIIDDFHLENHQEIFVSFARDFIQPQIR